MSKPANPDIKHFIEYAHNQYLIKFNEKLYINGRDAKTVQRLLSAFELDRLMELWVKFLVISDHDTFILKAGCTIPVFENCINKLVSGARRKKSGILNAIKSMGDGDDEIRSQEDNIVPIRRIS